MKKLLTLIFTLLLTVASSASAAPCPLPPANTDAEINFSDFEWYTDYATTLETAAAKGIDGKFDWVQDQFDDESCLTPHWPTIYNSINSFAGSEVRCGGYLHFIYDIPDVAGYRIDSLSLYMMWNPDKGYTWNYKRDGATQFYMAKYDLDVADKESSYNDLVIKLKSLYGDNPFTDVYGSVSPTTYTVWVNNEGALVGVSFNEYVVNLVYMAPGAEEQLCKVEEIVKAQEIENAKDNVTGL